MYTKVRPSGDCFRMAWPSCALTLAIPGLLHEVHILQSYYLVMYVKLPVTIRGMCPHQQWMVTERLWNVNCHITGIVERKEIRFLCHNLYLPQNVFLTVIDYN
jgi:hypothetical protein